MVSFAILGCGRIGRMHARNIKAHPRAELVGVYDVVAKAADEVANELGAKVLGSVDEALNDPKIDAVFIASSTDTHVDLITRSRQGRQGRAVRKADRPGYRPGRSLLERDRQARPPGHDRLQPPLRPLLQGAARPHRRVENWASSSRSSSPAATPPRRRPQYIKGSGGLFRDMTIHDFDMARYLAGDIVEVQAMGGNLIDPGIKEVGDIDAAMIILRAASGALVHINNSRRCAYGYDQRIEAFGEKGMLQAQNRRATTVEAWGAERTEARDPVLNFFIERYFEAYMAEIDHFVDCVEKRETPLASFTEGREALRLADAALESLRTGQIVRLNG